MTPAMAESGLRIDAPILIVGNWVRPLAQSAWRAGIDVVALDLFADLDTQRYARAAVCVAEPGTQRIDVERAIAAAQRYAADCKYVVYGAGFEAAFHDLECIAATRTVLGNCRHTLQQVTQPELFFPLLDSLAMPHPETALFSPSVTVGWLRKAVGGQGGAHVHFLRDAGVNDRSNEARYFQRYVQGTPSSVLFVADGTRARIVGWNELLVEGIGDAKFCYAGAISHVPPPDRVARSIAEQLDRLVQRAGLLGLNSLDFIWQGQAYFVLEINARPSATLDLYDADCPGGMLAWHIRACTRDLPAAPLCATQPRGHAVVYAQNKCRLPPEFKWPDWCSDVSAPGTIVESGAPLCMVHASAAAVAAVKAQLAYRVAQIREASERCS